jgi:4-amino-4-deoxy-L-arabinose transferase-like glycosyltransferase
MDDVDAVQAQIARNMLTSGDWVTARLDGVVYLEKAPLVYWAIASQLHDLRRTRLGSAHSDCLVGHCPLLVDDGVRRLGIR